MIAINFSSTKNPCYKAFTFPLSRPWRDLWRKNEGFLQKFIYWMQAYLQRSLDLFIFTNVLFERPHIHATVITQEANPTPGNQGTRNSDTMPFVFNPVCKILIKVPKIGQHVYTKMSQRRHLFWFLYCKLWTILKFTYSLAQIALIGQ